MRAVFNPTPNPTAWPIGPYPFLWREFLTCTFYVIGLGAIHLGVKMLNDRVIRPKNGGRYVLYPTLQE